MIVGLNGTKIGYTGSYKMREKQIQKILSAIWKYQNFCRENDVFYEQPTVEDSTILNGGLIVLRNASGFIAGIDGEAVLADFYEQRQI